MENGNNLEAQQPDAQALGPFTKMLQDFRAIAASNLQAVYEMQKEYLQSSAETLATFLSGGVDTLRHMQGIWFSTEEFVTTVGRAIFTTPWGAQLDPTDTTKEMTTLSPALYWRPTKELALMMYASAERTASGELWEYIHYAKQHVLSQSLEVIAAADSLSGAIQNLTAFYERFSARAYFAKLQDSAFQVYEERRRQGITYPDELGDWLRAERERLREMPALGQ